MKYSRESKVAARWGKAAAPRDGKGERPGNHKDTKAQSGGCAAERQRPAGEGMPALQNGERPAGVGTPALQWQEAELLPNRSARRGGG